MIYHERDVNTNLKDLRTSSQPKTY